MEKDTDLKSLHGDPRFTTLVAHSIGAKPSILLSVKAPE
jgi:hypothetical protein